jgi:predicted nucleotidyltransferase
MERSHEQMLQRLAARAERDLDVLAVILFGSRARGEATPQSDWDVCLVLEPARIRLPEFAGSKRLDYLADFDLDVVVFEQLPLTVRSRALREGQVLFVRDEDRLYELATENAKAYEAFKPYLRRYLDEVARG